jgi:hypothetical protein
MQRIFKANLYYSCPEEAPSTSKPPSKHPVRQTNAQKRTPIYVVFRRVTAKDWEKNLSPAAEDGK